MFLRVKPAENKQLSEEDKTLWRKSTEKFKSFEVGQMVLKQVNEIGRRTENKLSAKYTGPYIIMEKWKNAITYVLKKETENNRVEFIRAHQDQLRLWHEPPMYLTTHPVYKLAKEDNERAKNESEKQERRENTPRIVMLERQDIKKKQKKTKEKAVQTEEIKIILSPIVPVVDWKEKDGWNNEDGHIINDGEQEFIDEELEDVSALWNNCSRIEEEEENNEMEKHLKEIADLSEAAIEHPEEIKEIEYEKFNKNAKKNLNLSFVEGERNVNNKSKTVYSFEGFDEKERQIEVELNKNDENEGISSRESSRSANGMVKGLIELFSSHSTDDSGPSNPHRPGLRSAGPVPDHSWILEAGNRCKRNKQ